MSLSTDPISLREAAAAPATVTERRASPLELLRGVWRERSLIPRLGIRVVIKGFSGTILGRSWLVIRPVMSIFAMALLFGAVLNAPSQGVPYIIFLLCGMLGWMTLERCLLWGVRSFDVYRKLVHSFDFPILMVPTAALVPAALDLGIIACLTAITLGVFALTDGTFYLQIGPGLLLVPAGLALAAALGWGIALWLAPLNARARDVRLTMRYVVMVWLYVTPVLYPKDALPPGWAFLATINPATAPVTMVKHGLIGVGTVETAALAVSLGATAFWVVSGLWFISRFGPGLARAQEPGVDDEEDL